MRWIFWFAVRGKLSLYRNANINLIVKIVLIIFVILFIYYFRYTPSCLIRKFYDYKINKNIKTGEYIKAENLYKKKLFFSTDIFSKSNTVQELLKFYLKQRLYSDAEKIFINQVETNTYFPLYNCGNGNRELDLADTYNAMAIMYLNTGKHQKALEYTNMALQIFDIHKKESKIAEKFIKSYEILGLIYLSTDNSKKVKYCIEKIKHYADAMNNNEIAFYAYYNLYMLYCKHIKDYKNAEIFAKKMYTIIPNTVLPYPAQSQMVLQINHILYINKNLADIYFAQRNYADAKRMYENIYKLDSEVNGEYAPNTVCDSYYLLTLYKKIGNNELYERYLTQIKNKIKNIFVLRRVDNNNFESTMDKFCNIY